MSKFHTENSLHLGYLYIFNSQIEQWSILSNVDYVQYNRSPRDFYS